MDVTDTGLITRWRPLTESSLIVEWITSQNGRLSTVAKGARKPKSPFRGSLDLFFHNRLSLRRSRRSDLHTLLETTVVDPHEHLRRDPEQLDSVSFCSRLVEIATERDTPIDGIYQLMIQLIRELRETPNATLPALLFECRLLMELGICPDPAPTPISLIPISLLTGWSTASGTMKEPMVVTANDQDRLDRFLSRTWMHEFGRRPKRAFT